MRYVAVYRDEFANFIDYHVCLPVKYPLCLSGFNET